MLNRRRSLSLVVLALAALLAPPVFAANVDGKAGIGFEETLTSVGQILSGDASTPDVRPSGLAARYWIGNVGLEAIVGASLKFGQTLGHAGFVALGAHYAAFRAQDVNLTIGARGIFAWANVNQDDHDLGSRYAFAIEVPIRIEYFFTPAFAIGAAVGPVLHFPSPWRTDRTGTSVPIRNPLTTNVSSWDLSLTRGEFSGGLGFTYYFL